MDLTNLFSQGQFNPYSNPYAGFNPYTFFQPQQSAGQTIAMAIPFLNLPKKQLQNLQPAQNAVDAMVNTDNPMYQQIYSQQRQQGQQNLAEQIAEMSRQNRKLSALGRTPLFDQGRGGEQLFRGITQGYQDIQNNAANDTRGILGNAAQNYMSIGQQKNQIAQNKAGISGNIYGAIGKLFGL